MDVLGTDRTVLGNPRIGPVQDDPIRDLGNCSGVASRRKAVQMTLQEIPRSNWQ